MERQLSWPPCGASKVPMAARRNPVWIWFLACGAWLLDGVVNVYFHAWLHARLAMTVSLMFLAAGLFFSQERR